MIDPLPLKTPEGNDAKNPVERAKINELVEAWNLEHPDRPEHVQEEESERPSWSNEPPPSPRDWVQVSPGIYNDKRGIRQFAKLGQVPLEILKKFGEAEEYEKKEPETPEE